MKQCDSDVVCELLGLLLPVPGCCGLCSVHKSCPTLCDPMGCSPLDTSVHGISQARILKWVTILFSRGSSQPRDRTHVSCLPFLHWQADFFFLPLEPPGHTITWVDVILFHISETLRTGLINHCPIQGFPAGSDSKESACNAADLGSIPGWGRSPGEGNNNPLQYSCLENPMEALRREIYTGSQGTIENANSK